MTVCCEFVTFIKITEGTGFTVPGVTGHGFTLPTGQLADHEKFVPTTVEFKLIAVVAVPEQIDCPEEHEIFGTGFTSTEKLVTDPLHPLACGVI